MLTINGKQYILGEGNVKTINGVKFELVECFTSDFSDFNYARFYIGKDISDEVSDGDEFADDENYEWEITDTSIGIVLKETYDDEDEVIKAGEKFALPYNYIVLEFDGAKGLDYDYLTLDMNHCLYYLI